MIIKRDEWLFNFENEKMHGKIRFYLSLAGERNIIIFRSFLTIHIFHIFFLDTHKCLKGYTLYISVHSDLKQHKNGFRLSLFSGRKYKKKRGMSAPTEDEKRCQRLSHKKKTTKYGYRVSAELSSHLLLVVVLAVCYAIVTYVHLFYIRFKSIDKRKTNVSGVLGCWCLHRILQYTQVIIIITAFP